MLSKVPSFNPFPAIQHCRLLTHLLMCFGSLYCKQYGPRSDCSHIANSMDPGQTALILQTVWTQIRLLSYCKQYGPRSDCSDIANSMDPDQTAPMLQTVWTQITLLLYCKQYGPRSDCSHIANSMDPDQTALIRNHSVCFHDKIYSQVHLNICSRRKMQRIFSG